MKEGDAFRVGSVGVKVVPAYNGNHGREASVGYVVSLEGVSVYHAGDTSLIPEMAALAPLHLDYALFPTDGFWNMGGEEARRCADAVKARFVLAIHSSPKGLYDAAKGRIAQGPGGALLGTGHLRAPGGCAQTALRRLTRPRLRDTWSNRPQGVPRLPSRV